MKKILYHIFALLLLTIALASCGEDRTHEYLEKTEENQWIFNKMKEVYLWADDIKQPERSLFFGTTSKFFTSLLNKNDKSSFFTDTISTGSYGLDFTLLRDPLGVKMNRYYALVLFVRPGSPAEAAGIERGMWISGINGKTMTSTSGKQLLSGNAIEIATSVIEYDDENEKYYWATGDTIAIQQSRAFDSKAICLDTIYNVRSNKVGYIVCSNLCGDSFETEVQQTMLDFATNDVTDIVIDLRYCNEGTLENANAMASMLVPASAIGTSFVTMKGNDEGTDSVCNYTEQPVNLSDKKLFFITGNATKNIAELLVASVNASRGMHEVQVVGERSTGANVLTQRFDSPYGYSINPAVAFLYSSKGDELPSAGIPVDYPLYELNEIEHVYTLGSEQEYILRNIHYLIVNGVMPE